ncbi:pyruvate dehydrogenase (acetyl-transferring) E1 component subunit alpha [Candidatus Methylacidithermus pantelleriae]|uniref:Pyruvate dehydrogenase E1 component subunit alpha n=1 Tax=Candidatus Methylacidithermus pantelleriae TaxID=2744239 RepID=A0A8J2FTD0_9BACT|nr:pyruvate dehydrogenase (acetyl-transferring) E1 component subunit alpha [Candidatus Methylacidithermus pantelleriae]CAF0701818.1 Pyruvate dehydrogenase, subunit alpha (E1 component) [Candidatus Methylacidithermus pantelleriae]
MELSAAKDEEAAVVRVAPPRTLSPEEKISLYRQMLLIRRFEEKAAQAFTLGKIKGFCHLYIGQEAVAAGALSILEPTDPVVAGYRDHGLALARGLSPHRCMAELFGKRTGLCKGKGGSMHFFDVTKHFYGGHGIVAAQMPLAAGIAFAQKYQGTRRVTVCFLGDGAVNQGVFHETLNLVSVWKLPVVYIIENNQYAMGTHVGRSTAGLPLVNRARSYDLAAIVADGMDVEDVREKVGEAVHLARTEQEPSLIEARTYRYRGHSMADPATYRPRDELEKYRQVDPLMRYLKRLLEEEIVSKEQAEALDKEIRSIVQEAFEFADKSPDPTEEDLFEDVWAPEDSIPEFPKPRYNDF